MLYEIGDKPTVEEETPVSAPPTDEPAPEPEAPSSPDAGGGETPEAQPPAPESQPEQPAPAAEATAPDPARPSGETPTDIRTPFAFKVYGREVPVAGAYVGADGGIHIPRQEWDRHVQTRLVDPAEVQRRFREKDAEVQRWREAADPARNPDVAAAKLLSERISAELLADDLTEDQILDAVAKIRGDLPVLRERARADALDQRLQTYDAGRSEQEAVQALQRSVPVLGQGLTAYVQSALSHPEVVAAGLDGNELLAELWGSGTLDDLAEVFEDVDEARLGEYDPNRVLKTEGGMVAIRPSVDRMILAAARAAAKTKANADAERAAERAAFQAKEEAARKAQEVAEANRKALAPKPPTTPVIGAQGQPGGVTEERVWTRLQREASDAQNSGDRAKADELRAKARYEFDKYMGVV